MAQTVGDRARFAIEVADLEAALGDHLRVVDICIAGRSVCCDDNVVFVPAFVRCLQSDLDRLAGGVDPTPPPRQRTASDAHRWCRADTTGLAERYWFVHWGPTTDNLSTHLFHIADQLVITSQFWRGHMSIEDRNDVFVAELSLLELQDVLAAAIQALDEQPR